MKARPSSCSSLLSLNSLVSSFFLGSAMSSAPSSSRTLENMHRRYSSVSWTVRWYQQPNCLRKAIPSMASTPPPSFATLILTGGHWTQYEVASTISWGVALWVDDIGCSFTRSPNALEVSSCWMSALRCRAVRPMRSSFRMSPPRSIMSLTSLECCIMTATCISVRCVWGKCFSLSSAPLGGGRPFITSLKSSEGGASMR
mmetsp:Transcript_28014/g.66595  ORF Transcript_28014/g.66595 Transcript_28014/m.66595 type:complete len:200 (-) Transcript_28014:409-1008(-)